MAPNVVPMIHVPDVRATVAWYQDIGFTVANTYGDEGEGLSFAILSFGSSRVMFNQGGRVSEDRRREVDLYVYTENVDDIYRRLKDRVEIVEAPHDTFYGMREFIIRDLNRFWVTFGQPSAFELLMTGVRDGNAELVRVALDKGGLTPETLTAALAAAAVSDHKNLQIVELLERAGATPPLEVDAGTLLSYQGKYKGEQGLEVLISFQDGKLVAAPRGQQSLSLLALDRVSFRPAAFDGITITFIVDSGKAVGFEFKQGQGKMLLKRVEET